ncbi:tetratricopeptide repeat protein [Winogradskyella tangerina]|uniref:tetratricopeptide repeat protein n=1 Tax=Winogradskyella tangerina TaxID=2023240 RepID=UPI000DBE0E42|nr:tetratricopeptide repeat protein [Winogradskyella tangerina]
MFNNLFGKKKITEDTEFTVDFNDALIRYMGYPGGEIEYTFKDKKGRVIPPSHAFEGAYNEWKNIQSVWDKRSVIFSALDDIYLSKMTKSQIIERFVIDRYPEKALMFHNEFVKDDNLEDPDYLAALAKCYFFLNKLDESVDFANKALAKEKDHKKAQIILADALHLQSKHDEAHQIYEAVIKNSKLSSWGKDEINVIEIIDFNNDILHSSVYAVGLLSNEQTDEITWDRAAEEFYHCPYFRSQHAFWLLNKGESLRGMAKLLTCAQEFPWFKDAVINAKSGILQFREQMGSDDLWENELNYLNEVIKVANWESAE